MTSSKTLITGVLLVGVIIGIAFHSDVLSFEELGEEIDDGGETEKTSDLFFIAKKY